MVEIGEVFTKSKWSILKELSKGPRSASEIAAKAGQSTANVTVQLKLMEAQGIARKAKLPEAPKAKKKAGKPKIPYELVQDFVVMGVIKPGMADLKISRFKDLDDFQKYLFNAMGCLSQESQYALIKHSCETNLLKKADAVGLLGEQGNEIELFVLMESGLLEYREKHSNINIDGLGKTKKIISWSHNRKEVEEGLAKGDEYFVKLVKGSRELLDKKGALQGWNK